jgi:flagellar basal body-associated protein FliL
MPATDTSAKGKKEPAAPFAGADANSRVSRELIATTIAVPLLLAVIGGGGLLWLQADATEKAAAPAAPPEAPQFLKVDAVTVPLRRQDGTVAALTLVVTLDLVGGAGVATQAKYHLPRLRDAFLLALGRPPLRARVEDDRASIEEVKARLLAASRSVLGAEAVRDVLIQSTGGG